MRASLPSSSHNPFLTVRSIGLVLLFALLPNLSWAEDRTRIVFNNEPSQNYQSGVNNVTPVGDQLYFTSFGVNSGSEIWRTDGTPEGTSMLMDLCPGVCNGSDAGQMPAPLIEFDDHLFFVSNGDFSRGLWRSNDSELPVRLVHGSILELARLDEAVLFSRFDDGGELTLWGTDGTPGGTRQIHSASPNLLTVVGSRAFFHTEPSLLWTSDGTEAGTHLVQDIGAGDEVARIIPLDDLAIILTVNGHIWRSNGASAVRVASLGSNQDFIFWREPGTSSQFFFTVHHVADDETRIWRTDGTNLGTYALPIACERRCSFGGPISWAFTDDGRLFTRVRDFSGSSTLWVSDGTVPGTRRIQDYGGWDSQLVAVGNRAFYVDYPEFDQGFLWTTDGTTTRALRELTFADYDIYAIRLQEGEDKLWAHIYRPSENQTELWQSDGTLVGTRTLGMIDGRGGKPLAFFRGLYYFLNNDVEHGAEPWASNGTVEGTRRLADINGEANGLVPTTLVPTESQLFFTGWAESVRSLWQSDGTSSGTVLTPEIDWSPNDLIPIKDKVLVRTLVNDLWMTDGTSTGTELLQKDIQSSSEWAQLGDQVFFLERFDGADKFARLWRSDGTSKGTLPLLNLDGERHPSWGEILKVGDRLFFATDRSDQPGFWVSDGTPGGTSFLDLPFRPERPHVIGDRIYFTDAPRRTLWTSDGTAAGTSAMLSLTEAPLIEASESVLSILASETALYLLVGNNDVAGSAWRFDGSLTRLDDLPSLVVGGGFSEQGFVALSDTVFFTATQQSTGTELWKADAEGVRQLVDLCSGPCSSAPQNARVIVDQLYFAASDGLHGLEPWTTDGTAEGTRMLADIHPGVASSNPWEFVGYAEEIYFSAYHPEYGLELWAYDLIKDCLATTEKACLNEGRFEVSVDWRSHHDGVRTGTGQALPFSEQSNFFWFFNPENIELVTKILDGREINGAHWVFYGALTDVEYELTAYDRLTGREISFYNPPGEICGSGDILAFPEVDSPLTRQRTTPKENLSLIEPRNVKVGDGPNCQSDDTTLCLRDGRFRVQVDWRNQNSGNLNPGQVIPGTSESGYFWFFNPENLELIVKVLDGTSINGKFWVFYGALSDVEYSLTVTDLETGAVQTYNNPQGEICGVGDIQAFQ